MTPAARTFKGSFLFRPRGQIPRARRGQTHAPFPNIEANTESILKRQDEIFAKINELKSPVTIIPPNINGMFIRGYHIKLRYVVTFIVIIVTWAVAASVSSMKYKEEAFAYYSMYRAVKEQHQYLMEKAGIELKEIWNSHWRK